MDSTLGQQLALGMIRLAIACYLARLAIDARFNSNASTDRAARWFWTVGFALIVVHVLLAFAAFHNWSHAEAYAHSARRTDEVVGWTWGSGIYVNYVFLALWAADLIAWWSIGEGYTQRRRIYWTVQAIFAFMFFNATAVFGPRYWIAVTSVAVLLLIALRLRRMHVAS